MYNISLNSQLMYKDLINKIINTKVYNGPYEKEDKQSRLSILDIMSKEQINLLNNLLDKADKNLDISKK